MQSSRLIADTIRHGLSVGGQLNYKPVGQADNGQQGGVGKACKDTEFVGAVSVNDANGAGTDFN